MRLIQVLETLLEELDNIESVEEVRVKIEEMLSEEYEKQGIDEIQNEINNIYE